MRKIATGIVLAVALLVGGSAAHATTDHLQAGLKLIIKGNTTAGKYKTVYVSKVPVGVLPAQSPIVVGATVEVINLGGSCAYGSFDIPASNWATNGAGTLYKFVNKLAPGGPSPVKVALVKQGSVIKVVAKAEPYPFDAASQGALGFILTIGGDRYCSVFDSPIKDEPHKFIAKGAPAPGACPPAPYSAAASGCSRFTFTGTVDLSAGCGVVLDSAGGSLLDLRCQGLYLGGGASGVPWPATTPDTGVLTLKRSGSTLSATTAAETGSLRTCSSPGCLFAAQLPIPNTATPVLSTCITNIVATASTGSVNVGTGEVSINLPLKSEVNLFGDLWTGKCTGGPNAGKPCGSPFGIGCGVGGVCTPSNVCVGGGSEGSACTTDSGCPDGFCSIGVQNCPVCAPDSASTTGSTCHGGVNNGGACTPGSTDIFGTGDSFPVSHDCPLPSGVALAILDVPFALTTGTASKTSPVGQFCGFCKDSDASNGAGFGVCAGGINAGKTCNDKTACPGSTCGSDQPCTTDGDCASDPASREDCIQRTAGAFGKSAAVTISETGAPSGDLSDFAPHGATLVSVFCVPPTFDTAVQPSTDLPGPGAVSLPGDFQIWSPSGAFLE